MYSTIEKEFHGHEIHGGVDFELPFGTPLLAATDGWAIASYGFSWVYEKQDDKTEQLRLVRGDKVSGSIGLFVQLYNPELNIYVQYGHLSTVGNDIPYKEPQFIPEREEYIPQGYRVMPEVYTQPGYAKWVKAGDIVGYVGVSGIALGKADSPDQVENKREIWDDTHAHIQVFVRAEDQQSAQSIDTYGIYGTADMYPDDTRPEIQPQRKHAALWLPR